MICSRSVNGSSCREIWVVHSFVGMSPRLALYWDPLSHFIRSVDTSTVRVTSVAAGSCWNVKAWLASRVGNRLDEGINGLIPQAYLIRFGIPS